MNKELQEQITTLANSLPDNPPSTEIFKPVEPVRKGLKRGRKPFKPTKKILDKIFKIASKGTSQHVFIYPQLGISSATWYNAIQQYPELLEAINEGLTTFHDKIINKYTDLIDDPTRKDYGQHVRHAVDRLDKLVAKQTVTVEHTGKVDLETTLKSVKELSTDELIKEYNKLNDQAGT